MLWQEGLFEALVETAAKMPEPVRSFALRRAVEETEYRVRSSGRDVVAVADLLGAMRNAVSRSMYNALRRVLVRRRLLSGGGNGNA